MSRSDLAQHLPEALSGLRPHMDAAQRLASDARGQVFDAYTGRLATVIAKSLRSQSDSDVNLGSQVRDLVSEANAGALAAVLSAPDVLRALGTGRRREALLLVRSGLIAEAARREATPCPGPPLPASLTADRVPGLDDGGRWGPAGDYWVESEKMVWIAPTIAGRIVVDHASPSARDASVHGSAEPPTSWPELVPGDLQLFVDTLNVGYSYLDHVWPDAALLVSTVTRVVVPRIDPVLPGFGSFTTGEYIGRTVLSNGWEGDLTPLFLAETLLHESVHTLNFMLEEQQAWFLDESAVAAATAESRWTGDVIIARNYVHACFVWFAVWSFFRRALESGSSSTLIARRVERAARGFLNGVLITDQQARDWQLADHVVDLASEVQDLVRRHN